MRSDLTSISIKVNEAEYRIKEVDSSTKLQEVRLQRIESADLE